MFKFMIGCDPEFMVKSKGKLKSALSIFRGRKHEPVVLPTGATLADNVNFEFNTKPAENVMEFKEYIKGVLQESARQLPEGSEFCAISGADFPKSELKSKEACEFGCEPDYNAWDNGRHNKVPKNAAKSTFRSAGGHIHIGFTDETEDILESDENKLRMIRLLDATLGIVSVLLDKTEGVDRRRSLYGKAGCHRPKIYGVEYRTIGNFWASNPAFVDLIYDMVAFAIDLRKKEKDIALIELIGADKIISTINKSVEADADDVYKNILSDMLPDSVNKKIMTLRSNLNYDVHKNWGLS